MSNALRNWLGIVLVAVVAAMASPQAASMLPEGVGSVIALVCGAVLKQMDAEKKDEEKKDEEPKA